MKQELRKHVETNRNFLITNNLRLSEAAVEKRQEVSRHQKYLWAGLLLTDIAFQIGLLLTAIPPTETDKFPEVW